MESSSCQWIEVSCIYASPIPARASTSKPFQAKDGLAWSACKSGCGPQGVPSRSNPVRLQERAFQCIWPPRREDSMQRPRVLLADDHRMLAEACIRLLEPECEVVGTVTDGRALLPVARDLHPDVIVLDIGMPLLNGLEAARQIKQSMQIGRASRRERE